MSKEIDYNKIKDVAPLLEGCDYRKVMEIADKSVLDKITCLKTVKFFPGKLEKVTLPKVNRENHPYQYICSISGAKVLQVNTWICPNPIERVPVEFITLSNYMHKHQKHLLI